MATLGVHTYEQANVVHEVNGKDCAADVRRCIGLM